MFLHLSVINSVHREGGVYPRHPLARHPPQADTHPPLGRHPLPLGKHPPMGRHPPGLSTPPLGLSTPPGLSTPRGLSTPPFPGYGQRAGGTHPTGMQTFSLKYLSEVDRTKNEPFPELGGFL